MTDADVPAPPAFSQLGLSESIVRTLTELGYEAPTPIQQRTIPALLAGKDVIGQAQTGTGKTAAFSLPLLSVIDHARITTQALVLTPTRELALQVAEAVHSYSKGTDTTVLPVYGGAPIVPQMKHLQRGAQIVVGTPGRLIDHIDRKTLDLSNVKMVVLDEADEMLKMGFIEEVERMLSLVPTPRQIALFSATMPDEVLRIAQRHLVSPVRVEIEHKSMTAPMIEQRFLNVSEGQKLDVVTQILELESSEAVLIFRRTKTGAAELAEKLEARGFAAVAMHGDMNQRERENVVRRLRAGQIEIVVATDVAARGLDVEQIEHVINYDIPYDVEAYVHRVGRTGRAGRSGIATLFITPRERRMMREIERYTGTQIKPMKMPTREDIVARRIDQLKAQLRKEIEAGDLDLYVDVVTQLAEEGPFDCAEIAGAAARLIGGTKSLQPESVPKLEEPRYVAPAAPPRREYPPRDRDRDRDFAPREPRPPRDRGDDDEPKTRLSMAVGKQDGIRPADIVGSIANEADVPGREIGPIDIRDDVTYVTIPSKYLDQVLLKVGRAKFRGRPVNIQVSTGDIGPRPPFSPRREDSGPRREGGYKPREGGFKPREGGGYKPREGGFKPREGGGYKPREGGFKPREGGGFKPRGEGGFKPREGGGGFKPRAAGGFKPRTEGGYKPRRDRDDDRKPNAFSKFSKKKPPR